MNNDMPRLIAITAESVPKTKILAISTLGMENEISAALTNFSQASHSVLARADRINSESLLEYIRNLESGNTEVSEIHTPSVPAKYLVKTAERIGSLTRRELEILEILAMGHSNKNIASKLSLSSRTVNNHVGMIFLKLGVNSDSDINGRVSATLAFCIYSRVIVKSPSSNRLTPSDTSVSSTGIRTFTSSKEVFETNAT